MDDFRIDGQRCWIRIVNVNTCMEPNHHNSAGYIAYFHLMLWSTGNPDDERMISDGVCQECCDKYDSSLARIEIELLTKASELIANRWRDPADRYRINPQPGEHGYDEEEEKTCAHDLESTSYP